MRLGVSANTVIEYVRKGYLPCRCLPSGTRLFDEDDIIAFEKQCIIRGCK